MFGGDEVGAMVVDVGTCNTRVGFAGEDCPKCVFDTSCGEIPPEHKIAGPKRFYVAREKQRPREFMEITQPVVDGLIENWDALEVMFEYAFRTHLRVDPADHPLMIAEANFNTAAKREKTVELAFEKFSFPAAYLCKAAVLSAFSLGRTTALVLDAGGGVSTAVPVYDGYVLHKGLRRTRMSGTVLDGVTERTLFSQVEREICPRYCFHRETIGGELVNKRIALANITESYDRFMKRIVVRELKEALCRVSEMAFNPQSTQLPAEKYELPDGVVLDVGAERFSISDCLFQPASDKVLDHDFPGVQFRGYHHLVSDSISACDVDVRKEMFSNLILTGGTSLLPGFGARLINELSADLSPAVRVKIIAPSSGVERAFGAWIGGAILGSLGSFHQMWLSRQEYEEQGPGLLCQKCP